jgi:hypothetical protein
VGVRVQKKWWRRHKPCSRSLSCGVRRMVSFGLKLRDNIREQWRDKYLDYSRLKKMLRAEQRRLRGGVGGDDDSDSGMTMIVGMWSGGERWGPGERGRLEGGCVQEIRFWKSYRRPEVPGQPLYHHGVRVWLVCVWFIVIRTF